MAPIGSRRPANPPKPQPQPLGGNIQAAPALCGRCLYRVAERATSQEAALLLRIVVSAAAAGAAAAEQRRLGRARRRRGRSRRGGRRWSCRWSSRHWPRHRFRLCWPWGRRLLGRLFLGRGLLGCLPRGLFLGGFLLRRGSAACRLLGDFLARHFRLGLDARLPRFRGLLLPALFRCLLCSHWITPPVGPVCLRVKPIPRSRELKTLARVSASVIRDESGVP
jgi:hypothetical protein